MNHINIFNRQVIVFHPYWLYLEQHFKETCLSHHDCNNKFVINPTNHTHIENCESLLQSHGVWQWQRLWESCLPIPGHRTFDWFSLVCLNFKASFVLCLKVALHTGRSTHNILKTIRAHSTVLMKNKAIVFCPWELKCPCFNFFS